MVQDGCQRHQAEDGEEARCCDDRLPDVLRASLTSAAMERTRSPRNKTKEKSSTAHIVVSDLPTLRYTLRRLCTLRSLLRRKYTKRLRLRPLPKSPANSKTSNGTSCERHSESTGLPRSSGYRPFTYRKSMQNEFALQVVVAVHFAVFRDCQLSEACSHKRINNPTKAKTK